MMTSSGTPRDPASRTDRGEPARTIALAGQANFRDMGGYRTADGRRVKWRCLYRSGELTGLTDDDLETLADLGIRTVVDLRGTGEASANGGGRLPAGANLTPIAIEPSDVITPLGPAFESGDFSLVPEDLLQEINREYVSDWADELGSVLRVAADADARPLVFHCTHGKDRTGIAAAMLLSVLGVPWDTVIEDYLLSNTHRIEEAEAGLSGLRDAAAKQRDIPSHEVDTTNIRGLYYVHQAYLQAAHDEIINRHGSIDAFTRDGMGLTEMDRDRLRRELLE